MDKQKYEALLREIANVYAHVARICGFSGAWEFQKLRELVLGESIPFAETPDEAEGYFEVLFNLRISKDIAQGRINEVVKLYSDRVPFSDIAVIVSRMETYKKSERYLKQIKSLDYMLDKMAELIVECVGIVAEAIETKSILYVSKRKEKYFVKRDGHPYSGELSVVATAIVADEAYEAYVGRLKTVKR